MKGLLKMAGANPVHSDIEVYAVECRLSRPKKADADELREFARELMTFISAFCVARGAKVIGHIKAHLRHTSGFLHAHTVGDLHDVTVDGKDGEPVGHFSLVVNTVIFGLSHEAVREATESALENLLVKYHFLREP